MNAAVVLQSILAAYPGYEVRMRVAGAAAHVELVREMSDYGPSYQAQLGNHVARRLETLVSGTGTDVEDALEIVRKSLISKAEESFANARRHLTTIGGGT